MPDTQKLCIVDSMFFITGRGLVISTSQWLDGELKEGDWIELRSVAGESNFAQVKSFEMMHWRRDSERVARGGGPYSLLLAHINRDAVHKGDEVWSVAEPPCSAIRPNRRSFRSWIKTLKNHDGRQDEFFILEHSQKPS